MIEKLRKIQDSWFAKGILILTALSFVSLFGITGYIGSAGKNKPIISVGDVNVMQDEVYNQYDQELQMAKSIFGDNLDLNANIRNTVLQGIVQKELTNAIITQTALDNDVSISDDLIKKIIFSQAEFMNAEGKFDINKFRRLLSASGWSEQRYINALRKDVIKQHLVQTPLDNINIPKVFEEKLAKIEKQRKIFKYITIKPSEIKIDRKISAEELEQYYQDFATQFVEPENRDVSFVVLSTENMAKKIAPTEAEIEEYYNNNINQFVVPEKRNILQMVFENQDEANVALKELESGVDFYAAAKNVAKQDKAATELGFVSKDMLIADMSDAVFGLKKGEYAGPTKSELGWHIMKVVDINPRKETPKASAKKQIVEIIRKEKAYEQASEITTQIDDKIGAGASLEEIAEENDAKIFKVVQLTDNGEAKQMPQEFKKIIISDDFVNSAFSYNVGEISQIFETDDGFVLVRVDNIVDAHTKDLSEVQDQIEKMWTLNEKNAISQEIINDVVHDVENGDDIVEVAQRFKLNLSTSKPIKRSESFANLTPANISDLFQEEMNTPKLIAVENAQLIVVPVSVINDNNAVSKDEMNTLKMRAKSDITQNLANELVNAYGSKYKIKVQIPNWSNNDGL